VLKKCFLLLSMLETVVMLNFFVETGLDAYFFPRAYVLLI